MSDDATFPGAYLRNHVAPYCDKPNVVTERKRMPIEERYKAAMEGRDWLSYEQIAALTGGNVSDTRKAVGHDLFQRGLVEKKVSTEPRRGPALVLFRWREE